MAAQRAGLRVGPGGPAWALAWGARCCRCRGRTTRCLLNRLTELSLRRPRDVTPELGNKAPASVPQNTSSLLTTSRDLAGRGTSPRSWSRRCAGTARTWRRRWRVRRRVEGEGVACGRGGGAAAAHASAGGQCSPVLRWAGQSARQPPARLTALAGLSRCRRAPPPPQTPSTCLFRWSRCCRRPLRSRPASGCRRPPPAPPAAIAAAAAAAAREAARQQRSGDTTGP